MRICPRCKLKYPDENDRCFVDGVSLEVLRDERLGAQIAGRYLIESVIGEGGMATVYRARHTLVDKPVAVKIMNRELAKDGGLRERFRREAKNSAALAHPNIIEINDHGETDEGLLFMVMELLEGRPLSDLIAEGPMKPERVASIGVQIARGLARAHDFDVIHRDLKPENIFVCRPSSGRSTPTVKLLDFGIARSMHDDRLTSAGEIFGTPQYMAPERVTSIDAGPAADLYALGVILFEMLAGRLPFVADALPGYLIMHLQDTPPRPSELAPGCPRRLEELILSLLEKSPDDRPVDAHQVIKELTPLVPLEESAEPPRAALSGSRKAAPTLPPTTLERWAKRTAIFDEMLRRAFPRGDAPPHLGAALDEIRAVLTAIHETRAHGLKEQRQLEGLEEKARESRERLGYAVHTLAVDLSQAREAARSAHHEVDPYLSAAKEAKQAYEAAHERLMSQGGYRLFETPSAPIVTSLRGVVDSLDKWMLAAETGEKAQRWIDAKDQEVKDLEFQVQSLRANLARVEAEHESERKSLEDSLGSRGKEAERLERVLIEKASAFCEPLRPHRELGDLFHQLEASS